MWGVLKQGKEGSPRGWGGGVGWALVLRQEALGRTRRSRATGPQILAVGLKVTQGGRPGTQGHTVKAATEKLLFWCPYLSGYRLLDPRRGPDAAKCQGTDSRGGSENEQFPGVELVLIKPGNVLVSWDELFTPVG